MTNVALADGCFQLIDCRVYIRLVQQFDFGLLVSLDWLLKTVSVQQAAKSMNISPPAMSHTLARLRSLLDDPLLVRAGQRMVLTPKSMELKEPVARLVAERRALFSEQSEGGLRLMQRTFTIRASSTTAALFAASILAEARQSMPFAELRLVPEGDEIVGPLRDGFVDIEIGVQPDLAPEIKEELLLEEPFVVVRSLGHPLGRKRLNIRRYIAEEHVVASRRGIPRGPIDRLLAETGHTRKIPSLFRTC